MKSLEHWAHRSRAWMAGAAIAATALAGGTAAAADFDAAKHFKGKTITLVVDFKPGGGTDLQARYFAANWGRYIPGEPRIEVTNLIPNPSGRNYTHKSKPDGFTLSFVGAAMVGTELTDSAAEFDTLTSTHIGSHAKRDVVLLVRGTLPYKTLKDAAGRKEQIVIAEPINSIDKLDGKLMAIGLLSMWMDAPLKIATVARSGTGDGLVMLERGDINGYIAGSHWYSLPTLRPGWFKDGFIKPIADLSHPDAPVIANSEIGMTVENAVTWLTPEQRDIWRGVYLPEVLSGKGVIGPPDMAPELTKVLRDAYATAVQDPAFGDKLGELQGQPVALIRGEKMQQLVAEAYQSYKAYLPKYTELRKQVYDRYFAGN